MAGDLVSQLGVEASRHRDGGQFRIGLGTHGNVLACGHRHGTRHQTGHPSDQNVAADGVGCGHANNQTGGGNDSVIGTEDGGAERWGCVQLWSLFVACADPARGREAVTNQPLLLTAVGRVVETGRQLRLRLTSVHGNGREAWSLLSGLSRFLSGRRQTAEQLTAEEGRRRIWERILTVGPVRADSRVPRADEGGDAQPEKHPSAPPTPTRECR
jgi:hypothetical protein